jgi:excisionase family DNA binding protein
MEPLLTSAEAGRILKVHSKVLERWAKRGEVPALKVGKFWRYRVSDSAFVLSFLLQPFEIAIALPSPR